MTRREYINSIKRFFEKFLLFKWHRICIFPITFFFNFRHCVRVVKSEKAGMGKSLHKKRLTEQLQAKNPTGVVEDFPLSVSIPLSQKQLDVVEVSNIILKYTLPNDVSYPRIFHIDIAFGVKQPFLYL